MASNPTKAELAGEVDARLQAVESEFKTFQAVAAFRASIWERTVSDQAQAVAGLLQQNAAQEDRIKVLERSSDHPATLSAHDQRLKALEKGTDRVWQLLPVAVSAVALLLAAYVAFVKKSPVGVVPLAVMSARALAELIDAHAAALAVYARQWCGSPDDAVQEAFCKLAAARPWPDDPAAWLFTVARHAAMDIGKAERRRKRREGAVAKPERWFHEPAADGLDAATAVAALEGLAADQREVIVLRLWSDLTLEQIAAACGCSVSTAFRRYEAGVAALRQRLGAEAVHLS